MLPAGGNSMKTKVQLFLSLLAIPLLCFALRASATPITNIVTNGGFETGNFTGWTQGGNTSFTGVDMSSAHSGNFGVFAGPASDPKGGGGPGTLSQNLATVAGSTYELSFFMYGEEGGKGFTDGFGTVNFKVFWNGVMIFDTTTPPSSYTQFSFFNLTATGPSTELKFVFQNDPSFFHFDDVVAGITAVPETLSTLWLALPTLVMIGFLRLRRKTA
jgi:hypothetical protein